jgi:hypothetical protein
MRSEPDERLALTKLIKVVVSALLGAGLGLAIALVGFERMWQQPILELQLQPIHLAIVVGVSLLFGTLAAVNVKKFLAEFLDNLSRIV